jgi:hypothetical protein
MPTRKLLVLIISQNIVPSQHYISLWGYPINTHFRIRIIYNTVCVSIDNFRNLVVFIIINIQTKCVSYRMNYGVWGHVCEQSRKLFDFSTSPLMITVSKLYVTLYPCSFIVDTCRMTLSAKGTRKFETKCRNFFVLQVVWKGFSFFETLKLNFESLFLLFCNSGCDVETILNLGFLGKFFGEFSVLMVKRIKL